MIQLVAGEKDVLQQCSEYTDAWYELLAAKLFYTSPCCKQHELSHHVNNIIENDRPSDKSIHALMEGNLHQVIKEIQYMGDNGWFAAHLVDLLHTCGRLDILDKDQTRYVHS